MMGMKLVLLVAVLATVTSAAFVKEGFGKNTKGGEGGRVIWVTSLEDKGTGTLRAAVEASGPRIVGFKVSGVITLKSALSIKNPYITIDGSYGQTSDTYGVTLRDYPLEVYKTSEVIVRYIRVRLGDVAVLKRNKDNKWDRPKTSVDLDTINIDQSSNVIFDHVTASWSTDEVFSITNSKDVTVQWCLIYEPIGNKKLHPYGDDHAYGANNSADRLTYHHNLIAFYIMRGPQLEANDAKDDQGYDVQFEVANNLIYGYDKSGIRYSPGWEKSEYKTNRIKYQYQLMNNYIDNDDIKSSDIECIDNYDPISAVKIYANGNRGPHRTNVNSGSDSDMMFLDSSGKDKVTGESKFKAQISSSQLFTPQVALQTADQAREAVLTQAGCVGDRLLRDKPDTRVLESVRSRARAYRITSQNDKEGWRTAHWPGMQVTRDFEDMLAFEDELAAEEAAANASHSGSSSNTLTIVLAVVIPVVVLTAVIVSVLVYRRRASKPLLDTTTRSDVAMSNV